MNPILKALLYLKRFISFSDDLWGHLRIAKRSWNLSAATWNLQLRY